jgi:putative Holliday junction resolvase
VSRVLGVDLGARRVGLAISDPGRIISSPLETLAMESETALVSRLVRLCREKEATTVVIGLPLSADGSEGPGCARARRIAGKMIEAGIAAELVDESWSSRDAEQVLKEMGKNRRTAKEKVDAIAASLILRDYLEGVSRSL